MEATQLAVLGLPCGVRGTLQVEVQPACLFLVYAVLDRHKFPLFPFLRKWPHEIVFSRSSLLHWKAGSKRGDYFRPQSVSPIRSSCRGFRDEFISHLSVRKTLFREALSLFGQAARRRCARTSGAVNYWKVLTLDDMTSRTWVISPATIFLCRLDTTDKEVKR